MLETVYLATTNDSKYKMINDIFEEMDISRRDVDISEPQSLDAEEVVKQKARNAYKEIDGPVIVDDFSFYYKGLGDFPGPLIKHLLVETGVKGLKALYEKSEKKVYTVCNVAFFDGEEMIVAKGRMKGKMNFEFSDEKADLILMTTFVPEGYSKPLGKLDIENHRHKAYKELKEKIKDQNQS